MSSRLRTLGLSGFAAFVFMIVFSLDAQAAPGFQAAALDVADQALEGGAISVASVTAAQDGFIAAFQDNGGTAGALLGGTSVKKGTSTKVKIPVTGTLPNGAKVWVRLHIDAGTAGKLEFPGPDLPVKGADGKDLQKQIVIQVAAVASLPNTGAPGDGGTRLFVMALALLALGALLMLRRESA